MRKRYVDRCSCKKSTLLIYPIEKSITRNDRLFREKKKTHCIGKGWYFVILFLDKQKDHPSRSIYSLDYYHQAVRKPFPVAYINLLLCSYFLLVHDIAMARHGKGPCPKHERYPIRFYLVEERTNLRFQIQTYFQ